MSEAVRIVIVMEDGHPGGRWSAGSPDLLDFVLICASRAELEAQLPAGLEAHCGGGVSVSGAERIKLTPW